MEPGQPDPFRTHNQCVPGRLGSADGGAGGGYDGWEDHRIREDLRTAGSGSNFKNFICVRFGKPYKVLHFDMWSFAPLGSLGPSVFPERDVVHRRSRVELPRAVPSGTVGWLLARIRRAG